MAALGEAYAVSGGQLSFVGQNYRTGSYLVGAIPGHHYDGRAPYLPVALYVADNTPIHTGSYLVGAIPGHRFNGYAVDLAPNLAITLTTTYYLRAWDAVAGVFVYWSSVGAPDTTPASTIPTAMGVLSGVCVVGVVSR